MERYIERFVKVLRVAVRSSRPNLPNAYGTNDNSVFVYDMVSVVSKYHEPEEHMNIYEVPLTIKVNPMWYFISGM